MTFSIVARCPKILALGVAVAGNMLASEKVIEAIAEAFEKSEGETLAERR